MNTNFIIKFCFLLVILHSNINCEIIVVDDLGGCNIPDKHCPTFIFMGYAETNDVHLSRALKLELKFSNYTSDKRTLTGEVRLMRTAGFSDFQIMITERTDIIKEKDLDDRKESINVWFNDVNSGQYCLFYANDVEEVTKTSETFVIPPSTTFNIVTIMSIEF